MSIRTRLQKLERAAKRGPDCGLAALLAYDDEHPREPLTRATIESRIEELRRQGQPLGLLGLLRPEDYD